MSNVKRVLKWAVPVDDQVHHIGHGNVVRVACQHNDPETVYVWTEEYDEAAVTRPVQVFGTGHVIPQPSRHVGSADALGLVWHVYAVPAAEVQP